MQASSLSQSPSGLGRSLLSEAQGLGGRFQTHKKVRRELAIALPLTSLIDAFCIIVIYLLIGTQSGGTEVKMPNGIQLPSAESSASIETEMPTLRIEKGHYFVNDEPVVTAQLSARLAELKNGAADSNDVALLVQADSQMNYADLDPILRAGSAAGIQKLKFAVIPPK